MLYCRAFEFLCLPQILVQNNSSEVLSELKIWAFRYSGLVLSFVN